MKLNEYYKDWILGSDGPFYYLEESNITLPWSNDPNITSLSLDIQYMGNRSGGKTAAPLIETLNSVSESVIDGKEQLALTEISMFLNNWQRLWDSYVIPYNPLYNYHLTGTETSQDSGTSSNSNTYNLSSAEEGTTVNAVSKTGTVGTVATSERDKSITDTGSNSNIDNVFGFNSSTAVNSDSSSSTSSNSETTSDDVTTNETVTNNLTDTANYSRDLTKTDSSTETGSKTDSRNRTSSMTKEGNIGLFSNQDILAKERELWIEPYFNKVFADLDSLLVLAVY